MKDSHIGSYGVMALILMTLARWSALSTLIGAGGGCLMLIAVAALSRAPMVLVQATLPNARGTGLSNAVGRPKRGTAFVGLTVGCLIAVPGIGFALFPTAVAIAAVTLAAAMVARAKIGGQTGDVLGAVQQLAEVAALVTLTAML
jgi:adenosylcobinamide-GDP ribazoletransferase